ncbi:transposase [Xenorhabdus sp. TS4]|nr:transposase [Xenorhabdus sp. TS4]
MSTIKVVGIDLAKNIFQVCVWMEDGTVASNRKIPRQKLLDTLRVFPPKTLIARKPVRLLIIGAGHCSLWAIMSGLFPPSM